MNRSESIYGILEFSFTYIAGKSWKVTCRMSAVERSPLKVLEVSSGDQIMGEPSWKRFLQDMDLLNDFRAEAMEHAVYFFTTLRSPPAEA